MARIKKLPTVAIGGRIAVAQNGLTWGGVEVPLGTEGTVYLHPRANGSVWRCVRWDGLPALQPNGFPYGLGGDASKTFVPAWARLVKGGA